MIICIHLGTEDSTSTLVADSVQSQPTLGQWEDRHVRLLIESYLKFKGLIGQGNNPKKGVFDKIAVEFNKRVDIKVTGEQCLRKWKKLETKQKEIEDNNSQTGRAHKTWKFHKEMEQCIGDKASVRQLLHLIQAPVRLRVPVHIHLKQSMTGLTLKMIQWIPRT